MLPDKDEYDYNFCENCLTLMGHHVCTGCFEDINPEIGCDDKGRCLDCSASTESLDYAYGVGSSQHTRFKATSSKCPACLRRDKYKEEPLCIYCIKKGNKISEINKLKHSKNA